MYICSSVIHPSKSNGWAIVTLHIYSINGKFRDSRLPLVFPRLDHNDIIYTSITFKHFPLMWYKRWLQGLWDSTTGTLFSVFGGRSEASVVMDISERIWEEGAASNGSFGPKGSQAPGPELWLGDATLCCTTFSNEKIYVYVIPLGSRQYWISWKRTWQLLAEYSWSCL